jgi:hypothetical protein
MTPMRANIVGPPDVATRIRLSMAACHSAASCSAFGKRTGQLVPAQKSPERFGASDLFLMDRGGLELPGDGDARTVRVAVRR